MERQKEIEAEREGERERVQIRELIAFVPLQHTGVRHSV